MRLSFVIPARNEESYLPACRDSILEQTRDFDGGVEIIVVNNASTDRTREVALRYAGVTLVDVVRKGLPFAREAEFAACTEELVANIDADSRLMLDRAYSAAGRRSTSPRSPTDEHSQPLATKCLTDRVEPLSGDALVLEQIGSTLNVLEVVIA